MSRHTAAATQVVRLGGGILTRGQVTWQSVDWDHKCDLSFNNSSQ